MTTPALLQPHDLLWGLTPAHLPVDTPAWVTRVLEEGAPVVVRRAVTAPGQVAVGVRGATRAQRHAALMPVAAITRRVMPEQLCASEYCSTQAWPALQALSQLRPTLDNLGLVWGVSGSAGFELASGIAALHQGSDLDLILRTPTPLSRVDAGHILHLLDSVTRPVDMQLQTPAGAVALREWAGVTLRVLLKCAEGACLVADPWAVAEQAA